MAHAVAVALGVPTLREIFKEHYYEKIEGGILEAFGRLFRNDMRMYVCPAVEEDGSLTSAHEVKVQKHLQHLYSHLLENGYILNLDTIDKNYLSIHADAVLEKIRCGDESWQTLVPQTVVDVLVNAACFVRKVKHR